MGCGLLIGWVLFGWCATEPDEAILKADILSERRIDSGRGWAAYISSISQIKSLKLVNKQKSDQILEYKVNMSIQFDGMNNVENIDNYLMVYKKDNGKWKLLQTSPARR